MILLPLQKGIQCEGEIDSSLSMIWDMGGLTAWGKSVGVIVSSENGARTAIKPFLKPSIIFYYLYFTLNLKVLQRVYNKRR